MKIVSHFLVATVLVIFTYFSHGQKVSNAMCTSTYYQVPVQTNITNFAVNVLLPTKNQSRITQIFVQAALDTSSLSAAVLGTKGLLETFRIYGTFCQPTTHHRNTSAHALQILVHGIGFDSSYWDFKGAGVPEEDYSYVYQAANLGISTFRFDRLGTGLSERPDDGINVVQAATEVAILTYFAQLAKSTKQIGGQKWAKTVAVGHSYGSVQVQALSRLSPNLVNGLILTGFSINSTGQPFYLLGANYMIAKHRKPFQFEHASLDWLVTGSEAGAQIPFLYSPNMTDAARLLYLANEQPVTLGTFFTLASLIKPSPTFTGPVQVMIGSQDLIFALEEPMTGETTKAQYAASGLYPSSSKAEGVVIEKTGHAINVHRSASSAYQQMLSFVVKNEL